MCGKCTISTQTFTVTGSADRISRCSLCLLYTSTLRASGNNEITISSLSTSDYRGLKELTDKLIPYCTENKVSLSVPSLRADNFSRDLMERLQAGGRKSSLTFAPEAGTQRLRDVINKNLTEDEILTTCVNAFSGGWNLSLIHISCLLPRAQRPRSCSPIC